MQLEYNKKTTNWPAKCLFLVAKIRAKEKPHEVEFNSYDKLTYVILN